MGWLSPTGLPITGTLEEVNGRAPISGISDDGTPEFSGQATEIFWDGQRTVTHDTTDQIIFLDEEGGEWTFDQLVKETDEEAEEE